MSSGLPWPPRVADRMVTLQRLEMLDELDIGPHGDVLLTPLRASQASYLARATNSKAPGRCRYVAIGGLLEVGIQLEQRVVVGLSRQLHGCRGSSQSLARPAPGSVNGERRTQPIVLLAVAERALSTPSLFTDVIEKYHRAGVRFSTT